MATGPTVRRRRLGTELRRLRDSTGYKLEEVAAQLGVAPVHLVPYRDRQGSDQVGVPEPDARDCTASPTPGSARSSSTWRARGTARAGGRPTTTCCPAGSTSTWGSRPRRRDPQLRDRRGARAAADDGLRAGGLAGETFAAAHRRADRAPGRPADGAAAAARRRSAARLWAIHDEAVIRRPVGGPVVMRHQLAHLLVVAGLPGVTLQVLPFDTRRARRARRPVLHP